MIVEVRTYRLKLGRRADFLDIFETRSMPLHERIGIQIVGPLLDIENADVFVFLRAFPSLEERDRMKAIFYNGPEWTDELEPILMPMIESYSAVLTEAASLLPAVSIDA